MLLLNQLSDLGIITRESKNWVTGTFTEQLMSVDEVSLLEDSCECVYMYMCVLN